MSRGRPPRPIGVPGRVNRKEVAPGVWEAIVSVRDASGRPRKQQRISPPKFETRGRAIPDAGGNRAADAVQVAARDLASSPMDNTIALSTTIVELWTTHYRPYLVKKGRAQRTLDSYDREAERGSSSGSAPVGFPKFRPRSWRPTSRIWQSTMVPGPPRRAVRHSLACSTTRFGSAAAWSQ